MTSTRAEGHSWRKWGQFAITNYGSEKERAFQMTILNKAKCTLLFTLVMVASHAYSWTLASGSMDTPWTEDVSPEQVWPEYPRPQMVRPHWTNLNGLWDYAIVAKDTEQPTSWDGKILVPFAAESALSGVKKSVLPEQRLWYRRSFNGPELEANERLLLHFGAVDWACTLWLNGVEVGMHTGGYDPFSFDINDHIKTADNELVLAVWDPTDAGYQPHGKQVLKPGGVAYTAVTGIWQTVWMETVPQNYIKSLKIVPDIDRGIVRITVETASPASVDAKALDQGLVVAEREAESGEIIELAIPSAKLWSPDTPYLYDLKVCLLDNNRPVDAVTSYFGMRKIAVAPDDEGILRLKLNNEVLFQYGTLDQGWWPDGLYTPATDEAMQYDIAMTKKFGMNMARKHVKYECARWYYWCDKLGLLVWQDMPSGDSPRSDEGKENFRNELKRMIDALHSFPCIVMWVPFNEGWGQFDTPEIVEWIQQYDPTRPVNEASGWKDCGSGDISDNHTSPMKGALGAMRNRAHVLGEFGALSRLIEGHIWEDDRSWGQMYQSEKELTDAFVEQLGQLRLLNAMGLSGAVYIQTSDVEREVNGLMTYDRQLAKMDLERSAEAARKIHLPPRVTTLIPTSQRQAQMWRYTTTKPSKDWVAPAFDDSSWSSGPGAFGAKGTPNAVIGTIWNSSNIWLRRTITLDEIPRDADLRLVVYHDNDAEVYVNGTLIKRLRRYMNGYGVMPLSSDVLKAFKSGSNTLAVHCRQTGGDQGIDVGMVLIQRDSPTEHEINNDEGIHPSNEK